MSNDQEFGQETQTSTSKAISSGDSIEKETMQSPQMAPTQQLLLCSITDIPP